MTYVLNELADNGVVEVINGSPLDTLLQVLLLLRLEGELDENLLQLLVTVVDAKLLKGVLGQDLKTVNIEDTDDGAATSILGVDVLVDLLDDPGEEPVVGGLGQGITGVSGLGNAQGGGNINTSLVHVLDGTEGQGLPQGILRHLEGGGGGLEGYCRKEKVRI